MRPFSRRLWMSSSVAVVSRLSMRATSQRSVHTRAPTSHPTRVQHLPPSGLRTAPAPQPVSPSSPPLRLDPPFTPVRGEPSHHADAIGDEIVYHCAACHTPLFSSHELIPGSQVGSHSTGWPTFSNASSTRPLRRRATLQRHTVRGAETDDASSSPSSSSVPRSRATSRRANLHAVTGATTALTTRGLPVEADVCRVHGRGVQTVKTRTWREETLRDVNHRADPALLEGCCPLCGCAVCRLVTERGGGLRYVSTSNALVATIAPSDSNKA